MTNDEIFVLRDMPRNGEWTAPGYGIPSVITRSLSSDCYLEIEVVQNESLNRGNPCWRARLTQRGKKVVLV